MNMNLMLRIRSYPEAKFVNVWLIRVDGPAHSALLYGELPPATADALAASLGIPVEREASPLVGVTALPPAPEPPPVCPRCRGYGVLPKPVSPVTPCPECSDGEGVRALLAEGRTRAGLSGVPEPESGDLFADQPAEPPRPEPEPADRVKAPRKRRGKGVHE